MARVAGAVNNATDDRDRGPGSACRRCENGRNRQPRPIVGDPLTEDDDSPIRVLIMQSQDYFGPDSRIQAELADELDQQPRRGPRGVQRGEPAQGLGGARGVAPGRRHHPPTDPVRTDSDDARRAWASCCVTSCWRARRRSSASPAWRSTAAATASRSSTARRSPVTRSTGTCCREPSGPSASSTSTSRPSSGSAGSRGGRWALRRAAGDLGVRRRVTARHGVSPRSASTPRSTGSTWPTGRRPTTTVDGSAREFGFDDDTPVLAIVARLFVWKGHLQVAGGAREVAQAATGCAAARRRGRRSPRRRPVGRACRRRCTP